MPPRNSDSRSIKDTVLDTLKGAADDALRTISGGYPYRPPENYVLPGNGNVLSNLEVSSRIIRNITRTNQYYSEFYPYQGIRYHQERNNNKWFIPQSSSEIDYLTEFDIDEHELGK